MWYARIALNYTFMALVSKLSLLLLPQQLKLFGNKEIICSPRTEQEIKTEYRGLNMVSTSYLLSENEKMLKF